MSEFRPWFVTPAYRRFDLSAVCFDQRRSMIERLRSRGIAAEAVVIADDENLELARERGFYTYERPNDPRALGMKWNDGYQKATLMGATHLVPIGSDSILDPEFVERVDPEHPGVTTGAWYSLVDEAGARLAMLLIGEQSPRGWGVGPHVYPVSLLRAPFRPVRDDIASGCDSSLLSRLEKDWRSTTRNPNKLPFVWVDAASMELQYLAFRTKGMQINPYSALVGKYGVNEVKGEDVFRNLTAAYGPELAGAIREMYALRRARGEVPAV